MVKNQTINTTQLHQTLCLAFLLFFSIFVYEEFQHIYPTVDSKIVRHPHGDQHQ